MQMFRFIRLVIVFLLISSISAKANEKYDLTAIFQQLDTVIDAAPRYEEAKQARIGTLLNSLNGTKDPMKRYDINMQLFEEYRSYKNDTAITILENNLKLAQQMNRKDLEGDCLSLIAYQSSNAGRYADSKAILGKVMPSALRGDRLFHYYRAQFHLYNEIAYYSHLQSVKDSAYAIAGKYEALAMNCLDKRSADYMEFLCRHLFFVEKKEKEALKVCNEWVKMTPVNSREFALVAYYQYLIHINMGQDEEAIYWAARSAICDITHAVMDQASLWSIADYISGRDIGRSYKYIKFSWNCATKYGTSVRAAQISPILSVIEAEYKAELDKAGHRLMVITALIAVLAIVLCFMLYYATKQRHRLTSARNKLSLRNNQLAEINAKLEESNGKLKDANERITKGNAQLKESDHIKETYIGRYLALCSDYVNRMDKARKDANRLIKAHKIDELYQQTRSTEQKNKDVDELYGYFDRTFLTIFPTFVDDFNALLKPENRIETETGRLNTTLRIFALIRLGIDDSGKIAELLHYSVNTIYNYRARTKNGCTGNRDAFEDEVKRLGKI